MDTKEAVAIVGIGCRFPGGAHGPRNYWKLISEGHDLTSDSPENRFNPRRFYDPNPRKPGRLHVMHGGFLKEIDLFDHEFFGISPREADYLDPQQRLLLETAWEAFEDGGLIPAAFAGKNVGVFVGAFTLDYKILQFSGNSLDGVGLHTATGSMMTMCSNRLSHAFDLRGPSLSIDTACSSSLVATHLACRSLLAEECELALAGGVMLIATPHYILAESKGGFLCPDGRCKTFDISANGYARGEGVGLVVLKRLADAERDGDRIYAVIRASGVNQDGRTPGITVPSGEQQVRLLETVYGQAGIDPSAVHYVEAHGTGTPVGDPIEANALGAFFSRNRVADHPCIVGSVKTNMGHLESAAGIAGLIKTSLALWHRQIPPHLHLLEPNPKINFSALKLRVPTELEEWPNYPGKPYAGVNSFGFGGTNAHVVLEAHVAVDQATASAGIEIISNRTDPLMIPLSARSEDGLSRIAARIHDWIEQEAIATSFPDFAFSLACKRSHHEFRMGVVASDLPDLSRQLRAFAEGELQETLCKGRSFPSDRPAKLCFVYTGNGPQWWAMGRDLYRSQPVFRAAIDRCAGELARYVDWSLIEELSRGEMDQRMDETQIAQPANFAIQYALSELWSSWGIEPDACIGHSTGEIGSFWKTGVLSFAEAIRVVYERSRLQQKTAGKGTLVAVGLSRAEAESLAAEFEGRVSVAGVNAPTAMTLAGDNEAMAQIIERLGKEGVFCKQLRVNIPFHSPVMEEIRAEWQDKMSALRPSEATVALYATATGARAKGPELDAAYWWLNVRNPVYFQDCFNLAVEDGCSIFLEVGPHPVLATSMRDCANALGRQVQLLHSLYRGKHEPTTVGCALAGLYSAGIEPDFARLYPHGRYVDLPLYPFMRERCWAESDENRRFRIGNDDHPLLGRRLAMAALAWETEINGYWNAFLPDHVIQHNVLFPAAGYLEQAGAAIKLATAGSHFVLEDIVFHKALFLPQDEDPRVQTTLDTRHGSFSITSLSRRESEKVTVHAEGQFRQLQPPGQPQHVSIEQLRDRMRIAHSKESCYAGLASMGFEYGPRFQGIGEVYLGDLESLARLESPIDVAVSDPGWVFHPVMLDAAFQALIAIELMNPSADGAEVRLPVGIRRATFLHPASSPMWVHARIVGRTDQETTGDIAIYDAQGRLAASIEGFQARSIAQGIHGVNSKGIESWLYQVDWVEQALITTDEANALPQTCLILAPSTLEGIQIKARLETLGHQAILAHPGDGFAWDAEAATLTLNACCKSDYLALFDTLDTAGKAPTRIIHLWNLDTPTSDALTVAGLDAKATEIALSVLYLCQAVAETGTSAKLWFVTRGAQLADLDVPVNVAQAPTWGIGRVFGHQEHVGQWGGLVDLDPRGSDGEIAALIDEVLTNTLEDQVAFRGSDSMRKVMRIHRAKCLYSTVPPRFRADGAYWVTGAFGALGERVADWLVEHGAAFLILSGRSTLPPRERWSEIAADDPHHARVRWVQRIEGRGVRVLCPAIDCAEATQIAAFLAEYRAHAYPPVRGLFHCAGVVADNILVQMREHDLLKAYRPKVQGSWNLHHLLRDEPLEHFVLFSSVASLVTSTGQANYAAGNAFLDALAYRRRQLGLPGLSLNWGPWAIGMVEELDLLDHYRRRGMPPIHPDAGLVALEIALVQDQAELVLAEADWLTVLQYYPRPPTAFAHLAREIAEEAMEASNEIDPRQRIANAAAEECTAIAIDELSNLVVRVLRIRKSAIEPGIRLNDLGVDSMLATELRNRIELTLGVSLTVVDLLGDSTIEQLALKLLSQIRAQASGATAAITLEELMQILQNDPDLTSQLLLETERTTAEEAAKALLDDPDLVAQLVAQLQES
ncbi:MAG: type I polyketide synthase [Candidatus Competibacter denitrificans]|jgi:hybrid polyketide synthase/nonribosomal peptide synthetase FtdB